MLMQQQQQGCDAAVAALSTAQLEGAVWLLAYRAFVACITPQLHCRTTTFAILLLS